MSDWTQLESFWTELGAGSSVSINLLAAAVFLILGWIAALVLGRLAEKALFRLVGSVSRRGTTGGVVSEEDLRRTSRAAGRVVFWLVFALSVMGATERLGLPIITAWLSGVANYLPRILVAILVSIAGLALGRAASRGAARAAASSGVTDGARIGRLVELSVLAITVLVAVEALGIDITFLQIAILVVLSGLLLAAALSFGLGARDLVTDILACHYALRLYEVGQVIRLEGSNVQGRIVRVTPPCVVLETPEGEVAVPARQITSGVTTHVLRSEHRAEP